MKFKLLKLVMKESVEKESVLRRVAAEETLEESKKEELISKMEDPDNFKDLYYFSTHINDIEKIIDNCKDKKKLKTYKNVLKAARAFESGRKKKNMNESAEDRYQVREFDGPGAKFGVYDTKTKKFVQKGSKYIMNAACNDLNKKNLKEESNTYKDKDEAEYYRNKELYKNSNLARHRDAMNKAKKSCENKNIKLKEEETSFEEIINEMENATEYEELYNAAEKIANVDLKEDVIKFIQQCEDDGDSVEEAYSIVTSDLLDDKIQDLNEDAYITINDGGQEADYMIQDVTELEDVDDDTVEAPSVEGLLSLVNESLNNKYGTAWGYIKSKSISMKENLQYAIIDIVTPSVLREAEENKIKDKAVSKTIILESVPNSKSLVNLKVNTLAGTTRFSQKTREPAKVLTRWLESEYLYDEMVKDFQDKLAARQATLKDSTESYLKQHPDLKVRIDVIKAQEKMLKDAGMLENSMDDLARTAYGIAVEFPANIKVDGNKDNEYNMEFDTIDEIVKILFGESYVRDIPKEEKELAKKNKKVLKDNLKESEHNLSKDLFGVEAEKRNSQKQQELERDLQYVRDIMAGKEVIDDKYHEKLSLDTAKKWLRDDYVYVNNLLAASPEDINKKLAQEFPDIFGQDLTESEKTKEYYIIVRIMNKYNKGKEGFLGKNNKIVANEKDALIFNSRTEAQKALRKYKPENNYTLVKSNIESRKSLKESYETFNIGEIEGTFNTSTGEILYSIPSKNVTDKKVSLDKIPSTDTPYDTDTIIKNYIETHYGVIDRETKVDDKETLKEPNGDETEIDTEVTEKEPIEKSTDVKAMDESYTSVEDAKRKLGNNWPTYQDDVEGEYLPIPTRDEYERMWNGEDRSQYANTSYEGFLNALVDSGELADEELYNILLNDNTMEEELEDTGVDISDDLQEDAKSETGTSSFYKIRQRDSVNIDSLLEKASQGINSQESEYIVVKEVNLTPEEMQEVTSNLSKPQAFLQGVEPIDRKNYPFNVVKVTSESSPYTLLIDNVGYNYPRYVSVIQ